MVDTVLKAVLAAFSKSANCFILTAGWRAFDNSMFYSLSSTGGSIVFKRIFAFLCFAFVVLSTAVTTAAEPTSCTTEEGPPCIQNTFSPGNKVGVYDFGSNGRLVVQFQTVLTNFTLNVTINHTIDPLDPNVFPEGTAAVTYCNNQKDEYDFTGSQGGPNGVPVKNTDYKGLITLTLSYLTCQAVNTPAFGHAPETNDTTMYDEDILTAYSSNPMGDPTMQGQLPGLSSVAAFDEPLAENDRFCFVSPTELQQFTVGQEVEVEFQLFAGSSCTGTPIRDKRARFSLSTTVGNVFPRIQDKEEGNKFHWDNKDGVNEFDFGTKGLAPGTYTITVFGSKFSPQSVDIILVAP
jgi:hypothetical protein